MRIGSETVSMTSEIKQLILQHVKDYGTGSDTLRCLALGTVDNPVSPSAMDLSDPEKFVKYEVIQNLFNVIFIGLRLT